MTPDKQIAAPEHTAVRVALWRALHVKLDPAPHVFSDDIGERIVDEEGWLDRPDMNPQFSKAMRASIVGRARFVEDLTEEQASRGVAQYVILGAGLDTFAQRRPEIASRLQVFEVDQPAPQEWKRKRLAELGYDQPDWLRFVPVDFEHESWWERLINDGFDENLPSLVVSTGVSMYLTKEANLSAWRQLAEMAPGSTFAMTFMLDLDLLDAGERGAMEFVMKKAAESGTPFVSLFTPAEILEMAKEAGFKDVKYVSAGDIYERYFAERRDGLKAGDAEAFLVAST